VGFGELVSEKHQHEKLGGVVELLEGLRNWKSCEG
jgi:hypothetical protein